MCSVFLLSFIPLLQLPVGASLATYSRFVLLLCVCIMHFNEKGLKGSYSKYINRSLFWIIFQFLFFFICLSQYAGARCYPKKRWMGFDFKFKKFSIKQAFFINEIFSSRVKAAKQKKIEVFFAVFVRVFDVFFFILALFSKFETAIFAFDAIFLLQSFRKKNSCSHAKNWEIFAWEQKLLFLTIEVQK